MVTGTYVGAAWHLLGQARAELEQGDIRQASEKGWGAAAQMVKAIAENRGWQHRTHAALFRVVTDVVSETGDDEIHNLFNVANSLHTNFYENWNTAESVRSALSDVERLVEKLNPLME